MRQGVAGFQRGDDALYAGQGVKRLQRLAVGDRDIGGPAHVFQPGVFRPHAGIVEAGRDRVCLDDLAVIILDQISPVAMQDARPAGIERGRVPARFKPGARRLDPIDHDALVVQKGME